MTSLISYTNANLEFPNAQFEFLIWRATWIPEWARRLNFLNVPFAFLNRRTTSIPKCPAGMAKCATWSLKLNPLLNSTTPRLNTWTSIQCLTGCITWIRKCPTWIPTCAMWIPTRAHHLNPCTNAGLEFPHAQFEFLIWRTMWIPELAHRLNS